MEVGGERRSQGAMTSLVSWSKVLALGLVGNRRGRRKLGSDQTLTASPWTSLVVQWFKTLPSNAGGVGVWGGMGSFPSQGIKIPDQPKIKK